MASLAPHTLNEARFDSDERNWTESDFVTSITVTFVLNQLTWTNILLEDSDWHAHAHDGSEAPGDVRLIGGAIRRSHLQGFRAIQFDLFWASDR